MTDRPLDYRSFAIYPPQTLDEALSRLGDLAVVGPEHRARTQEYESSGFVGSNTGDVAGTDRLLLIQQLDAIRAGIHELRHSPHLTAAPSSEAASPPEPGMGERARAVTLATWVLDDASRDPDSDVSILARQFLRAIDQPETLDAAWKEAEAALPEGWGIQIIPGQPEAWEAGVIRDIPNRRYPRGSGRGPTPAEALQALATRLKEGKE